MGMFDDFKSYMLSFIGLYGNWYNLITQTTKDIFDIIRQSNSKDILQINPKKINIGHFYLIRYNYNGNPIWCPILTIEYKVVKNKNIMFAINLEYIPNKFKLEFFNLLFKSCRDILNKNFDSKINNQVRLPVKFEPVYKILKDNRQEYVITAYDMSKILVLYQISTALIPQFIMINTQKQNKSSMKDLYNNTVSIEEKKKLEMLLEEYDKILEGYELNSEEYHKKLKSFEQMFKLFENPK